MSPCETFEYLTRGDCASAGIQYSVLPSALSLTKVGQATEPDPHRHQRDRRTSAGHPGRPASQVLPVRGEPGIPGQRRDVPRAGLDRTRRGSAWTQPCGSEPPQPPYGAASCGAPAPWPTRRRSDPGATYLPRAVRDWHELPDDEKAKVRFLLLQNGDDPIPKFGSSVLWKRPDWLGPDELRPPGSPRGTRWMPVTTFFTTFVDMQNALAPTPGVFDEGGHDYRREVPEALRTVFRLEATDEQMARIQEALRKRELAWAAAREWNTAQARPTPQRAAAEQAAKEKLAAWTGQPVDVAQVERIIGAEAR